MGRNQSEMRRETVRQMDKHLFFLYLYTFCSKRWKKYSDLKVKVAVPLCRNNLLQVKVLHSNYPQSTESKSTYDAEWPISE